MPLCVYHANHSTRYKSVHSRVGLNDGRIIVTFWLLTQPELHWGKAIYRDRNVSVISPPHTLPKKKNKKKQKKNQLSKNKWTELALNEV